MSPKTSSKSFNRCIMQLSDWLHALGSVITLLQSSLIFTGYLFLNELNSRFYYLPSKLCISNLQPTFKTLSPATYLLDRFGHPLRSVWILLALTLRPMDLEHSLSQPPNFGTNYPTTYTLTRIWVFLSINLKPTFLRTIILVIRKISSSSSSTWQSVRWSSSESKWVVCWFID